MEMLNLALAGLIGYLIGSIPFGFFYVKWATGKNVLEVESGRTGATNTYRAAGIKVGLLTTFSDILKGAVAVLAATALLGARAGDWLPWVKGIAGIAAVVGHNWSVFLKFRGGAGTTPNIGWAVAVWPPILLVGLVVALGLFWLTGMASVVSLSIGALLPLIFGLRYALGADPSPAYLVAFLITGAIVTWALRPNIERIRAGKERIVGPRAKRLERRKQREMMS